MEGVGSVNTAGALHLLHVIMLSPTANTRSTPHCSPLYSPTAQSRPAAEIFICPTWLKIPRTPQFPTKATLRHLADFKLDVIGEMKPGAWLGKTVLKQSVRLQPRTNQQIWWLSVQFTEPGGLCNRVAGGAAATAATGAAQCVSRPHRRGCSLPPIPAVTIAPVSATY